MQRLFSMFPAGPPGVALLLLRVSLAVGLSLNVHLGPGWVLFLSGAARCAAAFLILAGLTTPFAAGLVVVLSLIQFDPSHFIVDGFILSDALALSLIGPGAYSIDARLFGRRKIVFSRSPRE